MLTIPNQQLHALAAEVGHVTEKCEQAGAAGKVQHTTPQKADEIIRKNLTECAKPGIDADKKIEGSAAIVGEPEWSRAGIAHYGKDTWKSQKIDNLNGFVDKNGKVWVHKDRGNPATMIHEGVHKYSNDALITKSQPLNEGVTEYFTRRVGEKENLAKGRRNYQENYEAAKAVADLVGEETLCKAYFGGDIDGLKKAVDKKQGAGTWDNYVAATKAGKWDDATNLLKRKR